MKLSVFFKRFYMVGLSAMDILLAIVVLLAMTALWILIMVVDTIRRLRVLRLFDIRHKAQKKN